MKALCSLLFLVLMLPCVLFPELAVAHSSSNSFISLSLKGQAISGDVALAVRDLQYLIDLDANGDGDIVCDADHPCDFSSNSGDFQPPVTLAKLKGFDLAPGDPWGKPNWFLCVQDTVVNVSKGVLRSATVRTLRRKTAM